MADLLTQTRISDSLPAAIQMDAEESELVRIAMRDFDEMQTWRNTTAAQWEEIAALIATNYVNTFYFGSYNAPGLKKTQQQIDATGMVALDRFAAIMDSLLTPRNQIWHTLTGGDENLARNRDVMMFMDTLTRRLFRLRYAPIGNFASQNSSIFHGLGAFGTGGMFVDQAVNEWGGRVPGFRYRSIPLGELFINENHQGLVNKVVRWFRLTAAQTLDMFGPERFPEALRPSLDQLSQQKFDFIHVVGPNTKWSPYRIDAKGKKFYSLYVSLAGRQLMAKPGGYNSFPYAISRYSQAPGEIYGRSPAMMVLPALKTLNAEKSVFLKSGHRAADPVLLLADDGIMDRMNLRPGAMVPGGVSADGRPLVHTLPNGEIQITKEMMAEEKALINDQFLVSLFQILTESPTMTATEVIERTNEKGILIAPNAGRQMSEYLGSLIHREITLLAEMGMLPPMPPVLREAFGSYEVEYTSPLARAMRAQDVAGFMRSVQFSLEIVNATQDPSHLFPFAFERAIPEVAEITGTPVRWMATDKEVAQKQKNLAQSQQQQAAIQALPAQAAMVKAKAVEAKAGNDNALAQDRGAPNPNPLPGSPMLPQGPGGRPGAAGGP